MTPHQVTLIPGDGISPEITAATCRVLDAAGVTIAWDEQLGGVAARERGGTPLADATIESLRATGVALKGPLTTPVGTGFRSVNVALRREFDLYTNLRPAVTMVPGERYDNVDPVLVRETTEGLDAAAMKLVLDPGNSRTPDLGGNATTSDFADAVLRRLN